MSKLGGNALEISRLEIYEPGGSPSALKSIGINTFEIKVRMTIPNQINDGPSHIKSSDNSQHDESS